jgi:hypothetical protein
MKSRPLIDKEVQSIAENALDELSGKREKRQRKVGL